MLFFLDYDSEYFFLACGTKRLRTESRKKNLQKKIDELKKFLEFISVTPAFSLAGFLSARISSHNLDIGAEANLQSFSELLFFA